MKRKASFLIDEITSNLNNESCDYSQCNVNFRDELFSAQEMTVENEYSSPIVMITYFINEAEHNVIDEYIQHIKVNNILYEKEKVGILYCNDKESLTEFSKSYGHGAGYSGRLLLTPLTDNLYFFIGTEYVR